MKFIDLAGATFGRLTVIERHNSIGRKITWNCRCRCGNSKTVRGDHLTGGKIQSCGCARVDFGRQKATHGMSKTKPYGVWLGMIRRCTDQMNKSYPNYGGRGISVCKKWMNFSAFWNDMRDGYADGLQIERKDNSGNYQPGNCCWATPLEQGQNKRNNTLILLDGIEKTLAQWSRDLGISHGALQRRLRDWGSVSKAVTTPKTERGWRNSR